MNIECALNITLVKLKVKGKDENTYGTTLTKEQLQSQVDQHQY